ncbi:hypothetical protein GCM10010276_87220 [Streptomyces longisporus]|uniref:Uncharacterized protein n=1 Tax=Streptomyces longisporus TaxID=1948 RepID=A0ABP6ATB2_STRLO
MTSAFNRPLTHPQILRDHRGPLTTCEPLTGLVPDPFTKPPPLGGQPATLRVPHATGLPQGSASDNTPKRSVGPGKRANRKRRGGMGGQPTGFGKEL